MLLLILHLIGDFLIQNNWMALNKKNKGWGGWLACQVHCITYSLPFLVLVLLGVISWTALLVIYGTHFLIDRYHFIEYFLAARNGVKADENFGYGPDRPVMLCLMLYIVTDNTFHLIINYLACMYL